MDLEIFRAIILGLVEGITEFLPISSTGHLIIADDILGFTDEKSKTFKIFIQLGAILAVIWEYHNKILQTIKGIGTSKSNRFLLNIFIAFLPAAFVGLLTHSFIKHYLFNPVSVAFALILGGIAILIIEKTVRNPVIFSVDDISFKQAVGIGLVQILSLFPGVSRAGATIMGAMCMGLNRKTAAEFSFFVAIPTMFAATLYDLSTNFTILNREDMLVFATGFFTSFFSALLVIKAFLGFIKRYSFKPFALYRIIFGSVLLFYYL